jgi:hypothetical protein
MDFVEPNPHQNAISKVYISRSLFKNIRSGDIIVFYRTKDQQGPAYYTSVVSTIGIIERVYHDVSSAQEFIRLCRKRSVFTDEELLKHWNWNKGNRPFVVNFLYAYSFPKRPNLEALINNGVIVSVDDAPRGFEEITREQFETILRLSESDLRFIVD